MVSEEDHCCSGSAQESENSRIVCPRHCRIHMEFQRIQLCYLSRLWIVRSDRRENVRLVDAERGKILGKPYGHFVIFFAERLSVACCAQDRFK